MAIVKHKGIPIELGGTIYTIAPLPLGALEQMEEAGVIVNGAVSSTAKQTTTVIDAAYCALRRNYPDMTREFVADELVDVGNMAEVFAAVMDVSGALRKSLEASAPAGEPTGVATP